MNAMTNQANKSKVILGLTQILIFSLLISCGNNQLKQIQGVFSVNKDSLRVALRNQAQNDNALASALFNKVIENATIEIQVKDDSVKGLMFLAGTGTTINAKIIVRNDSMIAKMGTVLFVLTPTTKGLVLKNTISKIGFQLDRTNQQQLSADTEKAIINYRKVEREKKEFEENLGKWQKGNFVDEFGDKINKSYAYNIQRGTHENSISVGSEVYVKTHVEGSFLYFQIFNSSMSLKENFPDSKFGTIKIKYPDGRVESERIFFFENTVSESPDDKNNLIYHHIINNDGELKLLIDLSTASDYYSDKYLFSIQKNNLDTILKELKN